MQYIKTMLTMPLLVALSIQTFAQQQEVNRVANFGENMQKWCNTDDITYRQQLEQYISGAKACRVDDGIMAEFVRKDESGMLSPGTSMMDTYFLQFEKLITDGKITYTHGQPELCNDIQSPGAFDADEGSLTMVSMSIQTKGDVNFTGDDLFYVRNGQITKIIDNSDGVSLGAGLRAYTAGNFDEAFKVFRQLAYAHQNNIEAQYYTAMMEKMRQGCRNLNLQFRQMESDMLLARVYKHTTNGTLQRGIRGFINPAELRFAFDQRPSSNGLTFKIESLSDSIRLYGFIDEQGRTAVPCLYSEARMFGSEGLACVREASSGLWGVIGMHGNWVIQPKYKDILPNFYKGHIVALCPEGYSEILNTHGIHISYIRGTTVLDCATEKYIYIRTVLEDGVHFYLFDYDGNQVDELKSGYNEFPDRYKFTSLSGKEYIVKRIW